MSGDIGEVALEFLRGLLSVSLKQVLPGVVLPPEARLLPQMQPQPSRAQQRAQWAVLFAALKQRGPVSLEACGVRPMDVQMQQPRPEEEMGRLAMDHVREDG